MADIHGLVYPHNFLESLPVLVSRPAPHSPIRALTAAQFAEIHKRYNQTDVNDAVLFPFLHGLEGDNQHQISFFSAGATTCTVPRYRGLVWAVCDADIELEVAQHATYTEEQLHDLEDDDEDEDEELYMEDDETVRDEAMDCASSSSNSSGSPLSASTTSTSVFFPSSPKEAGHIPFPPRSSHLLSSTFKPQELLCTTPLGPAFVRPRVPDGISLRNFGIQVPIFATLSDIVVYSPRGLTRASFALAERFKHAIEAKALERAQARLSAPQSAPDPAPLIAYNVFVVTDPFTAFEEKFPHLVSINSYGTSVNHLDFAAREKDEMRDLTRASEVADGLFLGNLNDVPLWQPGMSDDPFDASTNPDGYDVCIECHDCAPFPTGAQLRQAEEHFAALDALWERRRERDSPPFSLSDNSEANRRPRSAPNANAIIHLSFPSSPMSTHHSIAQILPTLEFLNNIRTPFVPPQSPPQSSAPHSRRLKVLLYSADGYTESSVLALCLLMSRPSSTLPSSPSSSTAQRTLIPAPISLPEAYLELQVGRGRSFFVYQSDVGLLRRVETKLRVIHAERERVARESLSAEEPRPTTTTLAAAQSVAASPPPPSSNNAASRWTWGRWTSARSGSVSCSAPSMTPVTAIATAMGEMRSASQPPPSSSLPNSSSLPVSLGIPATTAALASVAAATSALAPGATPSPPVIRRARASTSPLPVTVDHQAWFNDRRFEGSFPSRVLPFLYLGNLNHAQNAYMLHALGVTHVVSVGECALVPPPSHDEQPSSTGLAPTRTACGAGSSLWIEERAGRIKVLDIKGVCDDGIDSLRSQFRPICDWIEKARLEGGKVLIHCRVGVSRSATVTIAYLMRHTGLSLVEAYLIVRSRRLSVLIQPNLIFLANLCSWELELARERANGDPDELTRLLSKRLNWPYLSKEVHALNEKYLG